MRQHLTAILIIVLIAGVGIIWYVFVRPSSSTAPASVNPYADDSEIRQFRLLKSLSVDQSLFQNQKFQALVSFDGILSASDLSKGRQNPFLPF